MAFNKTKKKASADAAQAEAGADASAESDAPHVVAPPPAPAALPPGMKAIDRLRNTKLFQQLRKSLGDKAVVSAADFKDETQKLPTGIFPLDYALGGGFPMGRISTVFGRKSAGKTTSLTRALANAQRMCMSCYTIHDVIPESCPCGNYREPAIAYIDVEGAFNNKWAHTLGLDLDRMLFSRPPVAEDGIDILDALLRTGECDFAVLDSIAFLVPLKEQDEGAEDLTPGMQARLVGKMVRKVVSGSLAVQQSMGRFPTVFLVNQIREKIGVMFGSPDTTPGGNAPGFASSVELLCKPAKYEIDPETGLPLWGEFGFKVEKNKLSGTVKMEGTYKMFLSDSPSKKKGEIADEGYVVNEAQRVGIVTGAGAHWKALGEEFSGKSLIEKRMLSDREFSRALRATTMKVLLASV